jgi:acyl-CoA synthetase (AMP-forming)/AMP-acid ligase II
LLQLPLRRGERVLMVVTDCPEFFFLFWGAIKAGIYAEEIAATRMLYDQPETHRRVADFLSRKSS